MMVPLRNIHGQSHPERMRAVLADTDPRCTAWHWSGNACLNCGWTPANHVSTLMAPRLDPKPGSY